MQVILVEPSLPFHAPLIGLLPDRVDQLMGQLSRPEL